MKVLLQQTQQIVYFFLDRAAFSKEYGGRDIKVYRSNNYYWGVKAVAWAVNTYRDKLDKFNYKITMNLKDVYNTYCSKIVYQSYRNGVGNEAMRSPLTGNSSWFESFPYHLPYVIHIGEHGTYDGYTK